MSAISRILTQAAKVIYMYSALYTKDQDYNTKQMYYSLVHEINKTKGSIVRVKTNEVPHGGTLKYRIGETNGKGTC